MLYVNYISILKCFIKVFFLPILWSNTIVFNYVCICLYRFLVYFEPHNNNYIETNFPDKHLLCQLYVKHILGIKETEMMRTEFCPQEHLS